MPSHVSSYIQDSPFKLDRLAGLPMLFLWCLADMRFICRGVLGGEVLYRFSAFVSSEKSSGSDSEFLQAESPKVHSCLWKTINKQRKYSGMYDPNLNYIKFLLRTLHETLPWTDTSRPQHCDLSICTWGEGTSLPLKERNAGDCHCPYHLGRLMCSSSCLQDCF